VIEIHKTLWIHSQVMRKVQIDMNDWFRADVSAEYAVGLLQLMERRGLALEELLRGTGIGSAQLEGDLRLTTQQDAALLDNAVRLTDDPGIGFELGLGCTLTWHGLLGFGLMSCETLGEALELWGRYQDLRTSGFRLVAQERNDHLELHIQDLSPGAPMRQCALERLAIMTARLGPQLTQRAMPDIEIWFEDDQPDYFPAYRDRLPVIRYATRMCLVRMPLRCLVWPIPTANPAALRQVKGQCEILRFKSGQGECLVARVMNLMPVADEAYPGIEEVARALCMSSRTLKRKLHVLGVNFRQLIDDARKNEVLRDVLNTSMTIDEIAMRRGYSDAANLTRAFRRWTGESPSQYRSKLSCRLERSRSTSRPHKRGFTPQAAGGRRRAG
jgi:AraC-like DNA-binding protein